MGKGSWERTDQESRGKVIEVGLTGSRLRGLGPHGYPRRVLDNWMPQKRKMNLTCCLSQQVAHLHSHSLDKVDCLAPSWLPIQINTQHKAHLLQDALSDCSSPPVQRSHCHLWDVGDRHHHEDVVQS